MYTVSLLRWTLFIYLFIALLLHYFIYFFLFSKFRFKLDSLFSLYKDIGSTYWSRFHWIMPSLANVMTATRAFSGPMFSSCTASRMKFTTWRQLLHVFRSTSKVGSSSQILPDPSTTNTRSIMDSRQPPGISTY